MADKMTFDDLNLNENLLRGIFSYGFEDPLRYRVKRYLL